MAARKLLRRATASLAFRIRYRHGLFEVQEWADRSWRLRGVFVDPDVAETIADKLVRERSRAKPPRRRLGAMV